MPIFSFTRHHSRRHTSSRDHRDPFIRRVLTDPYLGWLLLIVISSIVSGVFVVLGYIAYSKISDRLSRPESSSEFKSNTIFNSNSLSKILKEFNNRGTERTNIIQGSARMSDPSL
ncbi:MAG: hypothetical protein AAB470_01965 [Patescibacteria group bacterium]